MWISEKIRKHMQNVKFQAVNEIEVETLGFFDCTSKNFCCFLGASKFISNVPENARMIITTNEIMEDMADFGRGYILVDNPLDVFWKLHQALEEDVEYVRKRGKDKIAESAKIGNYVSLAENNVVIEDNVVIENFVTIYENTYIKRNSIIRSGCRIGGIGFQEYNEGENLITINHYGGVIIGENVDIQNNSCIDRALFPWEDTEIGDNTKIDNMVHIAHATKIGKGCEIAANAVVAGRCNIGNKVWVGLGALVRNFVKVGDNSRLNIGSVVVYDVHSNESVSGNYAIDHKKFMYEQIKRNRER